MMRRYHQWIKGTKVPISLNDRSGVISGGILFEKFFKTGLTKILSIITTFSFFITPIVFCCSSSHIKSFCLATYQQVVNN